MTCKFRLSASFAKITDDMSNDFHTNRLSAAQLEVFQRDGFLHVPGVFARQEAAELAEHCMHLGAPGPEIQARYPHFQDKGYPQVGTLSTTGSESLYEITRLKWPHLFDEKTLRAALHPDVVALASQLLGDEVLMAYSMYFPKPPGMRGIAFHQDNAFLDAQPGGCLAAAISLDPSDEKTGALRFVPGSHDLEIQAMGEADESASIIPERVELPKGAKPVTVPTESGDCVFFGGHMLHGSEPNTSPDRWRRNFIVHFVPKSRTESIYRLCNPLFSADGEEVIIGEDPRC